jgi:hypothetical protein
MLKKYTTSLTPRNMDLLYELLKELERVGEKRWKTCYSKLAFKVFNEAKSLRHQEYLAKKPLKTLRNGKEIKFR